MWSGELEEMDEKFMKFKRENLLVIITVLLAQLDLSV